MKPLVKQVCIIGVGLLGASLGLALKARGLASRVTGVGHRRESLDLALARGVVDEASLDPAQGLPEANLVVIATPARLVTHMMDLAKAHCMPGAVIIDVASTKVSICRHARRNFPAPRRFVGCHPMAGGEQFGPEHGRADLFQGANCLVEQDPDIAEDAAALVRFLWEGVGSQVVDICPDAHDVMLARSSHLPHVIASAMAWTAGNFGVTPEFVGKGFRDATRIADSRPEIWRDICLENKQAVLDALHTFQERIGVFSDLLAREDAAGLEGFFQQGRDSRRKATGA